MIDLYLGPENTKFIFDINSYDDIAIMFSGGADSVLLLYLLLLENRVHQKKLSCYIIDRYNKPLEKAKIVFDKIKRLSNANIELLTLTIPAVPNFSEVTAGYRILSQRHRIIMSGTNKYPRETSIRPNHVFKFFQDTEQFKMPFKELEKFHIIDAYYKLGIEELLPYTHSCGLNLSKPCITECYNCRERAWAYQYLGRDLEAGC